MKTPAPPAPVADRAGRRPAARGRREAAGSPGPKRIALFALTLAAGLALPASAAADDEAPGPAFRLSWDVDGSALLLAGSVAASFFVMDESDAPACAPLCDRSKVNRFDRWAAGRYSTGWGTAGDVATAATIAFAPAMLLVSEGVGRGLNDSLVVGEAALAASAVQVALSFGVGRPRPRVYGEAAPLDDRNDANAGRSFFSGHVANCTAATVAATRALQRTGRTGLAWTVFGVGMAGSAFVGVARVGSGSHFPSDVVAGAAAGAGLGLLLPALHRGNLSVQPMLDAGRTGATIGGLF